MKIWSLNYDENQKDNFPQLMYKGTRTLTIDEETAITNRVLKMITLTHRDELKRISEIINNKDELPFQELYVLIYDNDPEFEFQTEYFVELLNLFKVEVETL